MLCSLMRELNVCLNSLMKNNVLCLVNKGGGGGVYIHNYKYTHIHKYTHNAQYCSGA